MLKNDSPLLHQQCLDAIEWEETIHNRHLNSQHKVKAILNIAKQQAFGVAAEKDLSLTVTKTYQVS